MGAVASSPRRPERVRSRLSGDIAWYAGAVLVGAVLNVVAAINQPYSYDEVQQVTPYGSNSVVEITTATRQPPLDPLLGALAEHLFGVGQIQDRLVPLLAGIGTLILTSVLLRRLGTGGAGAFAVLTLATAPLMVRYSTYARPYALPLFFMMVFVCAALQWIDQRQRRSLIIAAATAVALPLTRVPEPTAFLVTTAVMLTLLYHRGRLSWDQIWPLILASLGPLIFIGFPLSAILATTASNFFDPSPAGVIDRFPSGVHEIISSVVPLFATSFPWWPITLLTIVAALAVPASRRTLFQWWIWWPFLAAPVAFLLAYHFLNPFSFFSLPYRARAQYFFLPAYVLLVAALSSAVARGKGILPQLRIGLSVLLGALLVGQLPATADVVLRNAAPDFSQISDVLTQEVPDDAIVLYDRPSPAGQSRQPFIGSPRYMGQTPYVGTVFDLTTDATSIPRTGPVYVLINGQCASPGRCEPTRSPWDEDVSGWRIAGEIERFTLYQPTQEQTGRSGVIKAMRAFGDALGPELGYVETFTASALLRDQGRTSKAKALIAQLYAEAGPGVAQRIRAVAQTEHLAPFK